MANSAERGPVRIVAGCFDPLTAAHARRIEALAAGAGTLGAAVITPPDAILPARARAELVAALAAVDFVFEVEPAEGLDRFAGAEILREEENDARLMRELVRHVHERQSAR